MGFFAAINRANGSAWSEAFRWLILNIILILFPIIYAYLQITGTYGVLKWRDPISHGELTLVSLTLLGDGFYVISKGLKIAGGEENNVNNKQPLERIKRFFVRANFPGGAWFSIFSLAQLLFAVSYFASSFTINTALSNYDQILNNRIIAAIIILIMSMVTTFLITLIDVSIVDNPPDAQEMFKDGNKPFQDKMKKRTWRK